MNLDTKILQVLAKIPDSLKQEALHYATYLEEKYSEEVRQAKSSQKKHRLRILKGTFVLPLPDDFDEPLEDMKEYME